ncbi:phasin family protein [Amantichitinum ursilacus]|uniref:Phasin protein n=1 Tax=Amantichitinum ursilacus TaxID=857265 RepID=A0A0N0XN37_9NEIS|nr:phasin family protein [Amantichitinum ursilacus]KPC54748.1 Phasin protein [Amantichitinum ursilacus]
MSQAPNGQAAGSNASNPFARFFGNHTETLLAFAHASQDTAAKLVQLQLDSSRAALETSTANLKAAASVKNLNDANVLRQKLVEDGVDHLTGFSRQWFDITSHAQAQFLSLLQQSAGKTA